MSKNTNHGRPHVDEFFLIPTPHRFSHCHHSSPHLIPLVERESLRNQSHDEHTEAASASLTRDSALDHASARPQGHPLWSVGLQHLESHLQRFSLGDRLTSATLAGSFALSLNRDAASECSSYPPTLLPRSLYRQSIVPGVLLA